MRPPCSASVSPAGIEDHAVAGMQRDFRIDLDKIAPHARDLARERAALFPEARADQFLVIDAVQPAGEKSAREGHFQRVLVFGRKRVLALREGGIERFAINLANRGDVFGRFEPAFDLEGTTPRWSRLGISAAAARSCGERRKRRSPSSRRAPSTISS